MRSGLMRTIDSGVGVGRTGLTVEKKVCTWLSPVVEGVVRFPCVVLNFPLGVRVVVVPMPNGSSSSSVFVAVAVVFGKEGTEPSPSVVTLEVSVEESAPVVEGAVVESAPVPVEVTSSPGPAVVAVPRISEVVVPAAASVVKGGTPSWAYQSDMG